LDDHLIASLTLEEHMEHLSQFFQVLQDNGLTINPSKCVFAAPTVSLASRPSQSTWQPSKNSRLQPQSSIFSNSSVRLIFTAGFCRRLLRLSGRSQTYCAAIQTHWIGPLTPPTRSQRPRPPWSQRYHSLTPPLAQHSLWLWMRRILTWAVSCSSWRTEHGGHWPSFHKSCRLRRLVTPRSIVSRWQHTPP
jgi:hypothetical protein